MIANSVSTSIQQFRKPSLTANLMDFVTLWKRVSSVSFPEETKNSSVQQGLGDDAQEGTGTSRQEK